MVKEINSHLLNEKLKGELTKKNIKVPKVKI